MLSIKNKLKAIAAFLAILSAILVIPVFPSFNNAIINIDPKYQQLAIATNTLSDISVQNFKNTQQNASKLLMKGNAGFTELLTLTDNKLHFTNKDEIQGFVIIRTQQQWIFGLSDITPRYTLCTIVNNTVNGVDTLFKDDLRSWIETEKTNQLQLYSFWVLLSAVGADLISDIDITKEKVLNSIKWIKNWLFCR
jgi:hypothetical protein